MQYDVSKKKRCTIDLELKRASYRTVRQRFETITLGAVYTLTKLKAHTISHHSFCCSAPVSLRNSRIKSATRYIELVQLCTIYHRAQRGNKRRRFIAAYIRVYANSQSECRSDSEGSIGERVFRRLPYRAAGMMEYRGAERAVHKY